MKTQTRKNILFILFVFVMSVLVTSCQSESLYNYVIVDAVGAEYTLTAYCCNAYRPASLQAGMIDVICTVPFNSANEKTNRIQVTFTDVSDLRLESINDISKSN